MDASLYSSNKWYEANADAIEKPSKKPKILRHIRLEGGIWNQASTHPPLNPPTDRFGGWMVPSSGTFAVVSALIVFELKNGRIRVVDIVRMGTEEAITRLELPPRQRATDMLGVGPYGRLTLNSTFYKYRPLDMAPKRPQEGGNEASGIKKKQKTTAARTIRFQTGSGAGVVTNSRWHQSTCDSTDPPENSRYGWTTWIN